MGEEEEKLSIYLTGAEEDGAFLRAVAVALEARGHEVAVPAWLEDNPDIISEMKRRAGRILKEMEDPQPIELEEQIFLSFSSQDEIVVCAFGNELRRSGVSVWNFTSKLRGVGFGPNWVDGELQALSTCCGVVVFFSRSSIESEHVRFEIDFTLERMRRRSGVFFCAVFLEELPLLFPETVPVIYLYKMGVETSVGRFIEKAVAFYRSHRDSTS